MNNRWLHDASLISLFGKTKGFFCFSFNNRSQKALPSFFWHTFLLKNKLQTSGKKIQGWDFLLTQRQHAKIQFIWKKKKKTDIEWLCSDIFNYVLVLAPKAIFSGNSSLPPFDKPTFLNSNLVRNLRDVPVCQCLSVFVTVEAWFTLVMELKAEEESEAERALQSCVNQKTES